ncbi:hypothetical protein HPB52_024777 [Rhipicephalus sanguineus]|uniref:Uncharacterized protein n=1 Tax=Rhipicephalus sanguineus TaxID=34632 RepID=A0A9D4YRZ1_RHISA|nr:hypothetical protein HPB52_024777 [Rhipicephalus sanguineus]
MDYDSSEEEEIVTVLMCSAIVSALAERKPSKKKRRCFLRMPPRTFDTLLELLRPAISKQDTNYRPAISAHDRLAMTIRSLATGETQRDVAFNFLAGRSTVSSIVAEVTQALWLVLEPLYL